MNISNTNIGNTNNLVELSGKFIKYNNGPEFKTGRIITKRDIVNLCDHLGSLEYFRSKGISFKPEEICEGGILMYFQIITDGFIKQLGLRKKVNTVNLIGHRLK